MDKPLNCPNNVFDCGVACGMNIAVQAGLKVLSLVKEDDTRVRVMNEFLVQMHGNISEKHLEHMNSRYDWEDLIDKLLNK